jgi:glycosyltransferase involved in cell wall biosynthesis
MKDNPKRTTGGGIGERGQAIEPSSALAQSRGGQTVTVDTVMTQPLISCIVPVFNGARYIAEALESILNQTYRPLEVIVVDDGSTDHTPAVMRGYGDRIRSIRQDNGGPAAARNRGLSEATGDFVAFLDADDLWHPEKLERQSACFRARPELDLCFTHVQNFWIPELENEKTRLGNHRFTKPLPGYATQALLARRAIFDRVGGFNSGLRVVDDTDWFLRAFEKGAVVEILLDVLVQRRLHHGNLTRSALAHEELMCLLKNSIDRKRGNSRVN